MPSGPRCAIAAVISVIAGESLTLATAIVLGLIAIGVATVAMAGGAAVQTTEEAAFFGAGAAIAFGFSIYGTAQAGISLPVFMAVLPARVAGVGFVFIPMLLARRLQFSWKAVPFLVVIALGEVFGNVSYVFGARESIAIASVLAVLPFPRAAHSRSALRLRRHRRGAGCPDADSALDGSTPGGGGSSARGAGSAANAPVRASRRPNLPFAAPAGRRPRSTHATATANAAIPASSPAPTSSGTSDSSMTCEPAVSNV